MPEVNPQKQKQLSELISRMEKGFDENMLDPLLESIYNEPEEDTLPSESKVKYKKKKFQVIRVAPTAQGDSLAGFLGGKIGESFNMAAQARAADPNEIKKDRLHYLKKAAAFNFGGDLVNRTKGTFSSDPTDVQDPALGKSGRFSAQVQPDFEMQQGPLPAPENENDSGIGKAFANLVTRFDQLIKSKDNKEEQLELAVDIQDTTTENVEKHIKESTKIKKKAIEVQKKFISLQADEKDTKQAEKVEIDSERIEDVADTEKIDNRRPDEEDSEEDKEEPSILDTALDFFTGSDIAGDIGDRVAGRVGRRGAGRAVTRTAIKLGGRKLAKTAAVKASQAFIKKAALGLMRPLIKRIPLIGGLIDFAVSLMLGEPLGRAAAKAVGATLGGALGTLIPVPFAGTILGGFLGDMVGGAVYDALTGGSGGGETKPKDPKESDAGTSSPTAGLSGFEDEAGTPQPDPYGPGPDINRPLEAPPEKLASGGYLAGEAGPEYKFDLSSETGKKVVKNVANVDNAALSGVPFILGIVDKIVSQVGGSAIKPFLDQEIGPLARLFGLAQFNVQGMVGKGLEAIQSVGTKFDVNMGGTGDENASSEETMAGGPSSTPVTGIPLGEGDTATGQTLHAGLVRRGFSREEAAAIVGNLWAESNFKTGIRNPTSGAYGLMQWLGGRYDKLLAFAAEKNKPASDLEVQLDYIAWELKGGNQYESAQFQKAMAYGPTIADKTRGFAYEVERAGAGELQSCMSKRVGAAQSVMKAPSSDTQMTPPPPPRTDGSGEDAEDNGGHDANNPGPSDSRPAPAASPADSSDTLQPPAPIQVIPLPKNLQGMKERGSGRVTFQPIIIQGQSQPIGFQKNTYIDSESTSNFFYDKTGNRTTLEKLKKERLQRS